MDGVGDGGSAMEGFPILQKLETLDVSHNFLNASILSSLNGLTALTTLNLRDNLIDSFSAEGFSRSKELEILDLSFNSLNCSILTSLHGFTALRSLTLSANNFNRSLSAILDVQNLRNLKMLSLRDNYMSGSIEGLCQLKGLVELDISKNMFGGKLPECLSNLTNLRVLELSNNLFSGNFPSFTTNLTSLAYLSLYGTIPSSFGMLSNMEVLLMAENLLEGEIPIEISNLPKLQIIDLSENSLMISLPLYDQLDDDLHLEVEFRTKNNDYFYKGKVLENMTGLDLSCNKLTESLDLSNNNLSGKIPYELTQLNFLSIFNLSYNNLSGTPPSTGQFANFDEENYRGNPGLCGPLLSRKCEGIASSPSNDSGEKETKVDM
ncbi:hypothetical protein TSUD_263390 [Trifolium subterraneum]|uniref:EAL domain-containing protein n=1 Tax=Trifolium subterraneum TaxID=3900 RepID=A0A2Z6PGP3_TRISU|nr:hypothetical protein TSUD_263390 [Trifolium subterraneum]